MSLSFCHSEEPKATKNLDASDKDSRDSSVVSPVLLLPQNDNARKDNVILRSRVTKNLTAAIRNDETVLRIHPYK